MYRSGLDKKLGSNPSGPDAPWPYSEYEIYQILTCPDTTTDLIQAHFNCPN